MSFSETNRYIRVKAKITHRQTKFCFLETFKETICTLEAKNIALLGKFYLSGGSKSFYGH